MNLHILLALFLILGCSSRQELKTVQHVDVTKYVGRWYSIASLPQFFTRNCLGQMADYKIKNPQTISVLNTCLKEEGRSSIKGEATVSNAKTNAELVVTFDSFLTRLFRVKGDYNIIELDSEYRYVTVASRDRKSLWIMSRTPDMPEDVYKKYVEAARAQKFAVDELEKSEFK